MNFSSSCWELARTPNSPHEPSAFLGCLGVGLFVHGVPRSGSITV